MAVFKVLKTQPRSTGPIVGFNFTTTESFVNHSVCGPIESALEDARNYMPQNVTIKVVEGDALAITADIVGLGEVP